MAKLTAKDLAAFRQGQVLWGWPHCVQNEDITQVVIDKKLSFIAWEAMNLWPAPGVRGLHVFHKNNEIAGYAAVMHALQLAGRTGCYGAPLRGAVIHFGLTGRGAIHALLGLGLSDVTCFALSPPEDLAGQIPGVAYRQLGRRGDSADAVVADSQGTEILLSEELGSYDVIVNCIFQDTDQPLLFLRGPDVDRLRRGSLIVDVSCDRGLGFDFAKPTSFREPTFQVGDSVTYYAVDHTPSYLWRSATYEISRALLPYLPTVMGGSEAWEESDVVRNAIEIRDGGIVNPKILSGQRRDAAYPHAKQP
jgi:alanine dehydrogenase